MSLTAPEGVKAALRRALDWIEEGKGGKGLEPTTIQEAHRLADGEACTLAKARKALRFYARNARYPKLPGFKPGSEGYPSPARVSWDLWGGSDGPAFFRSVVRQLKPELLKRDAPGVWGDPLEELEEERAELQAIVEGWLDPEGRDLTGDPAEIVGDGEAEEAEWKEWVLPIFALVTAKTLDVAADSSYALTWQQQRAIIIRRINAATAAALEGSDVPRRRVIFGLTPGNVATLTALETELRKRGTSEEDIQTRLRAESIALRLNRALLIAENETIAAHAGAVTAAWSEGLSLGLLPAGTRRQWLTSLFSNICPICAFLDEQIVGINEPFIGPDGSPYHAPGFHPHCHCRLKLVKEKPMERAAPPIETEEESAKLPAVLSEATIPPALAAGMGPVARALLVAIFNAYTAAGMGAYSALDAAKQALWCAGFRCNTDGTWTRPDEWEKWAHEEEEYRSPRGVMRAGKVLSAANGKMLREIHDALEESCGKLKTTLRACGYMPAEGEEVPESEPMEESRTTERVEAPVAILRSAKTGDEFWGFANVSAVNGQEVEDAHGTNFSVEELGRAMDKLAMDGRYLSLDHDHNGAKFAGRATQAMVITPELLDHLKRSGKTGLLIKGRPMDEVSRQAVLSGKVALSIAGRGRVV
jgi:hypothetical protein